MTAVLRIEAIGHVHEKGLAAVDDLTLDVHEGEVVCLLGPSGCGKTTALRCAAGLEHLQRGRVWIDGRLVAGDGADLPPEARGVGMVFQDYALFPHLSALDNVGFGLEGLPAPERRARALDVLHQVGMAEFASAYPHALSGGQQQRVALARALAPRPRLMLMDEPFSGLDARLRDVVRDQTLHLLKQSGAAVLMVTHDPEEAMFMADRIALMRAGRLVQLGSPAELYFQPADAFVASFFGEVNRFDAEVQDGAVETSLGSIAAPDLASGTKVQVLVRPEALHLDAAPGQGACARVMAARLLGRTSLVHLELRADGQHCHARVRGSYLPPEHATVHVRIDHALAYVFPDDGA